MGKVVIENLTKQFGEVTAVDSLSLTVNEGELVTVVGPSGCGKTTLLRMIAGFITPETGKISLGDSFFVDTGSNTPAVVPEKREIGMVFQSYAIWPHMNVFDNIAYPLKIRKLPRAEIKQKVEEVLELIKLGGYARRMPNQLSGGQQQRVAVARALVMEPKLLLLDEPLSNLDATLREGMRAEIKSIQRKLNLTIINVTHDQQEALSMSDKVAILNKGKLIQLDTPHNIYKNPVNTFVANFVASSNIIEAEKLEEGRTEDKMRLRLFDDYVIDVPYVDTNQTKGFASVRTHHIKISSTGTGVRVKVINMLYLGNSIEYYVQLVDSKEKTTLRFTTDALKPATKDIFNIEIKNAIWLDE